MRERDTERDSKTKEVIPTTGKSYQTNGKRERDKQRPTWKKKKKKPRGKQLDL